MSLAPRPIVGAILGVAFLAGAVAGAQTPKAPNPQYLPFAEFAGTDTPAQVSVKQGYNDAVERYNKALYDYHVTLGQHDQLVDAYNKGGTSMAEQEKARAEAVALRAKLDSLRRDVTALAGAVDQARRKASQAGVTLTR
jgi:outer membrane murein-binding lipoprotein Lpp